EVHLAVAGARERARVRLGGRVGDFVPMLVVLFYEVRALGDVVPVGLLGVSLLTAAAVKCDSSAARGTEALAVLARTKGELADNGRRDGAIRSDSGSDLDADGNLAGDCIHSTHHSLQLCVGLEDSGAGTGLVDHVDGAPAV